MLKLFTTLARGALAEVEEAKLRDDHEARRMANRLDEARAEKLLMEVGRAG